MRPLSRSSRPLVDDAVRLGRWGGAAAIRGIFGKIGDNNAEFEACLRNRCVVDAGVWGSSRQSCLP
jgi:hypothetical protein